MTEDKRRAALESGLQDATRRYNEAADTLKTARETAAAAVLAALRGGVPPTTVIELSPFTGTYVRQLARGADIPPATTRRPPKRRDHAN